MNTAINTFLTVWWLSHQRAGPDRPDRLIRNLIMYCFIEWMKRNIVNILKMTPTNRSMSRCAVIKIKFFNTP